MQILQEKDCVKLVQPAFTLKVDTQGVYQLYEGERLLICAEGEAKHVDGRSITTRQAAFQAFQPVEGGVDAVYQADNGLVLTMRFTAVDPWPGFSVQAILSDASGADVESRYLAPAAVIPAGKEQPHYMKSHLLSLLRVPYDNDMWTRFEAVPFEPGRRSYDVTAMFNKDTYEGVIFGFIDHDTWKNAIECSAYDARTFTAFSGVADASTHDSLPHGTLIGKQVASARMALASFSDVRDGMEAFGQLICALRPPIAWNGPVPFGWNSFAGLAGKFNAGTWRNAGDFLYNELLPGSFESEGTNYVNLDGGWQRMIDQQVMLDMMADFHKRGQKAGTYIGPFLGFDRIPGALERKLSSMEDEPGATYGEVLLRDDEGNPLPKIDGMLALDPTHPMVLESIRREFKKYIDWGFDYIKMDFLSHAAVEGDFYDKRIRTGRQAYTQALKMISDIVMSAPHPVFLSLSIDPIFPHGYGHARRMSCDAFGPIEETAYVLNCLTYGWWANHTLYHFNDPDHIVLMHSFHDWESNENESKARYTAAAIAGTVMLLSDDYGPDGDARIVSESLNRARKYATNPAINAIARAGETFRPLFFNGAEACDMFVRKDGDTTYVAMFNLTHQSAEKRLCLCQLGLQRAQVTELWTGEQFAAEGEIRWQAEPCDAAVFAVKG
ncbi:MAG: hypothetical protein ACOYJA_09925 [Christensenellales bacterium]|jgi:alpha-galactosidase